MFFLFVICNFYTSQERIDEGQKEQYRKRGKDAVKPIEYTAVPRKEHAHTLVVNYASLDADRLPEAMALLAEGFAE